MNLPDFIKQIVYHPYVKFLFVAGVNTIFGFSVYAVMVFLLKKVSFLQQGDRYMYTAVVLSTIINVSFNFKTYGKFVFQSNDNSRIFRFFAVYAVTTTIQMLLLRQLKAHGVPNDYLAGGLLVLPMSFLSFLLMRRFVFNVKPEPPVIYSDDARRGKI